MNERQEAIMRKLMLDNPNENNRFEQMLGEVLVSSRAIAMLSNHAGKSLSNDATAAVHALVVAGGDLGIDKTAARTVVTGCLISIVAMHLTKIGQELNMSSEEMERLISDYCDTLKLTSKSAYEAMLS